MAFSPFDYPIPNDLSYIAQIDDHRVFFSTEDNYSKGWFYPRYRGGLLHEPFTTRYIFERIERGDIFVDVGAHLGYFSLVAALKAKNVFAIEALEFLVPKISSKCFDELFFEYLHYSRCGGSKNWIYPDAEDRGAGKWRRFGPDPQSGAPYQARRLLFRRQNKPSMIKIDTEGYELNVLKGAEKILRHKPRLIIEVHDKMENYGHSPKELYLMLRDFGYDIRYATHRESETTLRSLTETQYDKIKNGMLFCE